MYDTLEIMVSSFSALVLTQKSVLIPKKKEKEDSDENETSNGGSFVLHTRTADLPDGVWKDDVRILFENGAQGSTRRPHAEKDSLIIETLCNSLQIPVHHCCPCF